MKAINICYEALFMTFRPTSSFFWVPMTKVETPCSSILTGNVFDIGVGQVLPSTFRESKVTGIWKYTDDYNTNNIYSNSVIIKSGKQFMINAVVYMDKQTE